MGDIPIAHSITVTFADVEGKTRLTLAQANIPDGETRDNMIAGWNESLDKLGEAYSSA